MRRLGAQGIPLSMLRAPARRRDARPGGASSRPRHATRGLSLIELLVAIAIGAVLIGAAVISVDAVGGARVVEREAMRLAALTELACQRAMLSGRDVGIHFGRRQYGYSIATQRGWTPEPRGSDLRERTLPDGLSLAVVREGAPLELLDELPDEPQAACFPSGELTPFEATVHAGSSIAPYALAATLDGKVAARAVAR